jgi:hypothetical protein
VWTHTVVAVEHTVGDPIRRLGALLHDVRELRTRIVQASTPFTSTSWREPRWRRASPRG